MRIAQVSPLYESVPPQFYGGTERVVSFLTEALVARGHEITLFASGGSVTSASLVPVCPRPLRLDPSNRNPFAAHMLMIEHVARRAAEFDVVHFHTEWLHMPLFSRLGVPCLTTMHGRLDSVAAASAMQLCGRHSVISISDAQRDPVRALNWIGTVHHGLPPSLLPPSTRRSRDYLAFLGRMSPEKQPDAAIRIARAAGWPIRLAAKIDPVDQPYFDLVVRPLLKDDGVSFLGEIGDADKADFLGGAAALLFPIAWPEPFGMVLIEAAACGTPVVAFRCGSVPEVVEDGVTGFIVTSELEAAACIEQLSALDPVQIRQVFEQRFTSARMATDYEWLYAELLLTRPASGFDLGTTRSKRGSGPHVLSSAAAAPVAVGKS